jgi:hypothetical protein
MKIARPLLLCLSLLPAPASAVDWTGDPAADLKSELASTPAPAEPASAPASVEPAWLAVDERLDCRPEVIAAFKEAWSKSGSGREEYEAAFRIDAAGEGYAIEFMPMTHEEYQLPVRYYPSSTVAIVHTHPNTALRTPGPGDYDSKVPNFILSRTALYVTVPGTTRHRFVRGNWRLPCAGDAAEA